MSAQIFARSSKSILDAVGAMQRVGDEVRRLREEKQLTLRALAEHLSVSAPFLSDVEHGRRRLPRVDEVEDFFGVSRGHFATVAGVCPHCHGTGVCTVPPASSTAAPAIERAAPKAANGASSSPAKAGKSEKTSSSAKRKK